MRKTGRRFLAFLMVCIIVNLGFIYKPIKAETVNLSQREAEIIQSNNAAVLSVEAITLGQGFVLEPILIKNAAGLTVDEMLYAVLGDRVSPPADNYYLSRIEEADKGIINIPESISLMPAYSNQLAPSNEVNTGNDEYPALSEFSYSKLAGWLYAVNNVFPSKGMHDYVLKTGDVVRVQFSVYGYGADIGNIFDENMSFAITCANKDRLLSSIAFMNMNKDAWFSVSANEMNYYKAVSILTDLTATQQDVDKWQIILSESPAVSINDILPDEPQIQNPMHPNTPSDPGNQPQPPSSGDTPSNPDPTEPSAGQSPDTIDPGNTGCDSGNENLENENSGTENSGTEIQNSIKKPKKAQFTSIKSNKGKLVQLKWKRVSNATGYQIYRKDSSKGKYKKIATIKSGKVLKYTDKNIRRNKTYNYKIRAYNKVNGKIVNGSFSNVRKIKTAIGR